MKKYTLGMMALLLSVTFFPGVAGAKQGSKPVVNRILVNGKVVLDTCSSKTMMSVVQKNIGQTIVILPRSSFSGIWQETKPYKVVRGKMISVFANGQAVIDSKEPRKIYAAVNKLVGKRIVVKQRDKEYPEFSPERMNVILKGPYSKQVLQDYLKVVIKHSNCLSTKPNKVIKQWNKNGIIYNQYQNGGVISFSCIKTTGARVQVVHEFLRKDYFLNLDNILIYFGKDYFKDGGLKRGKDSFYALVKSQTDTYVGSFKAVDTFTCG